MKRDRLKQRIHPKSPNVFPPMAHGLTLKGSESGPSALSRSPSLFRPDGLHRTTSAQTTWTADVNAMKYSDRTKTVQLETGRSARKLTECADITLLVGRERAEFNVNRIFLAMISPVFRAMLYGQMKEAALDSDVAIEDVEPAVFEIVVKFAYFEDPQISSINILQVLTFCDKYHITGLQGLCYEFLKDDLTESSFPSYYWAASSMEGRDQKVLRIINDYFCEHFLTVLAKLDFCVFFKEMVDAELLDTVRLCMAFLDKAGSGQIAAVLHSESFLSSSTKTVRTILQRSLRCKEEKIWESAVQWALRADPPIDDSKADDDWKDDEKVDAAESNEAAPEQKEADKKEKETADKEPVALSDAARRRLESVKDLIRFGLMDGLYFTRSVLPTNVLSPEEAFAVLRFYQDPEGGCGPFDAGRRGLFDVTITRGTLTSASWSYAGRSVDALCITPNKDCCLTGIGVWDCEGALDIKLKIFEGENGSNPGRVIYEMAEQTFRFEQRSGTPFKLEFEEIQSLKKDQKYTIEIKQKNHSSKQSYKISDGKGSVTVKGLTITFSNAKSSPNSTSKSSGAIPRLYVSV